MSPSSRWAVTVRQTVSYSTDYRLRHRQRECSMLRCEVSSILVAVVANMAVLGKS